MWKTNFSRGRPAGSPAVAYGVVFIPSGNRGGSQYVTMTTGPTVGLDVRTGRQVWAAASGSQGYGAPAIFSDTLWDGSVSLRFAAYDLRTGSIKKAFPMAAQSRQFVNCAVSGDLAYGIGTICGDIAAIDVNTLGRV